jgi:hypothetical protein
LHAKILTNHMQDFCMFLEASVNKLLQTLTTYPDRALLQKKSASTRKLKAAQANADLAESWLSEGHESDGQPRGEKRTRVVQFGESTVSLLHPIPSEELVAPSISPPGIQQREPEISTSILPPAPVGKGILKKSGQKPKWKTRGEDQRSGGQNGRRDNKKRSAKKTLAPKTSEQAMGSIPVSLIEEGHPITTSFNREMNKQVERFVQLLSLNVLFV